MHAASITGAQRLISAAVCAQRLRAIFAIFAIMVAFSMELAVPAALPDLEDLPSRPASQVKNRWSDVVRQVRESGSVAVTNHSNIEMVLIDAATYRQLVEDVQALRAKEKTVLAELDRAFQARLAVLQAPQAPTRVDKLFAARGRLKQRPKAGSSF